MNARLKANLRWGAALLMLAGLVWWIDTAVGWVELLRPWRGIPSSGLLSLVVLTALSYLTRAMRLFDLYAGRLSGRFSLYLRISVLHTTLLNLLPMRMGEAAFPLLMKRHFGERYAHSIANLLWLRVADLWILLWLGLVVFAVAGNSVLWIPVAAGIVLPLSLQPLRNSILAGGAAGAGRVAGYLRLLVEGLPARFRDYLRLLLWTMATWTLKLAAFFGLAGFFVEAPVQALVPGIIAAEISSALPVQGVAGFGSYELALVLGSSWSALSTEALLVAAVNLHLFILACTLAFGALALLLPTHRPVVEG